MRAFVTRKTEDGRREKRMISDAAAPAAPGRNEVKVKTLYTGLTNGTERNDLIGGNYATPDENLPAGMGYQNVGEVISLGSEVTGLSIGDIVYSGTWLASDHAEEVTVPAQKFDRFAALIRLPEAVEPSHAALFGIASVAVRACRAANINLGDDVLIVGLGLLGQLAGQVARAMGAKVTACDIDEGRLALAQKIGSIQTTINTSGDGWQKAISAESFDSIMDFAGVPGMEDSLLDAIKVDGTIAFVAGRQRVNYDFNMGQFKEISIRQIAHFDINDLEIITDLVAAKDVTIEPLIQAQVKADACGEIYDTLRDSPSDLLGVVFDWR